MEKIIVADNSALFPGNRSRELIHQLTLGWVLAGASFLWKQAQRQLEKAIRHSKVTRPRKPFYPYLVTNPYL